MDKKNKTIQKFHKYPISDEFGIYKLYRIPFDERIFKNADKSISGFFSAVKIEPLSSVNNSAIVLSPFKIINIAVY